LHAYKLKSPLEYRTFYKHERRDLDFDVWTKPKEEQPTVHSIFEAGDTKDEIEKEVQK
jgi:hypothetical protein